MRDVRGRQRRVGILDGPLGIAYALWPQPARKKCQLVARHEKL